MQFESPIPHKERENHRTKRNNKHTRCVRAAVPVSFPPATGRVLVQFSSVLLRKGSAKGGGICDARVEVQPFNWLTPEAQDPERDTAKFRPLRWQRFFYRLPL